MKMKNFFMKVNSWFVKKPTRKLMWTNEDYNLGMKWAKTQPHPFKKGKTLWDLCYDRVESVNSIDNLNKFLFNEI
jgi:hypothetical protein